MAYSSHQPRKQQRDRCDETEAPPRQFDDEQCPRHDGVLSRGSRPRRGSREAFEASNYLNRLWSVLIEDLASPENDLPPATRADLISIGLWVLREIECIRLGQSENFSALIDVTKSIREGLR